MKTDHFQPNSAAADKKDILYKLLQIEPDTLDNLKMVTGWSKEATQMLLLQLVVDGKIKCRHSNGRRTYFAIPIKSA